MQGVQHLNEKGLELPAGYPALANGTSAVAQRATPKQRGVFSHYGQLWCAVVWHWHHIATLAWPAPCCLIYDDASHVLAMCTSFV